jgi:hypothetical protein
LPKPAMRSVSKSTTRLEKRRNCMAVTSLILIRWLAEQVIYMIIR